MAEHYVMSNTSYSDLERGKSSSSTLTLLLLLHDQEDPTAALNKLIDAMNDETDD